jgi:hypothetical protein
MRFAIFALMSCLAMAADKPAKLSDFAWMEGHWQGLFGEALAEEVFMAPKSGAILNMFRLTKDGNLLVYEISALVETADAIELRVRHFNAKLEAMESEQPIVLKLVKYDGSRAEFENFIHTAPKRTIITKKSNDEMDIYSEILHKEGPPTIHKLTMRRVI